MTTPAPASRLSQMLGGKPATPSTTPEASSALGRMIAAGPRGDNVTIPGLGVLRVQLLGVRAGLAIESAVIAEMTALGIARDYNTVANYEAARAIHTLAASVVDPNTKQPIGSLEEWGQVDSEIVRSAWLAYSDVSERLDPTSTRNATLTAEQRAELEHHARRGNHDALRGMGSVALAAYAIAIAPTGTKSAPVETEPAGG